MKVLASTFLDFALSEGVNTRVRADGRVELASRNGFSNPDFRDIDADGKIEGVDLLAGPVPTGSHVYVRYLKDAAGVPQRDTRLTRQNSQVVGLDATYPVNEPIVEGTEPPDPSRRSALPAPPAPTVEVVATAKKGFPAPFSPTYYGIAVCGIVGNPRRAGQMSFTTPGPVSTVVVGQGNYIRVFLQQLVEGYSGLVILVTDPKSTLSAAANGTLYFQRILDGRRRIRSPYPLVGPLKTRTPARTVNETYIGAFGQHPAPRLQYGPGGPFTLAAFMSRITYQFRTSTGESADQQYRTVDTTAKAGPGRALYVRLPRNARQRFPGATEWRMKFEGSDGLWYVENWLPIDTRARLQTNNPKGYHPSNEPEQSGRITEDATGVPAPDAELDDPEALGPTLPLPGTYAERQSLEAEGEDSKESPPSAATRVTIAQGQYFRILPARVGNELPNAELSEIDAETGDPVGWTFNRETNLSIDAIDSTLVIDDATLSTTVSAAAAIAPRLFADDDPYTFRAMADMTRRTSGSLSVNARFFDSAKAFISSAVLQSVSAVGLVDIEVSAGVLGTGADVVAPAGTKYITFALALNGAVGDTRDFGATLYNFEIIRGLAASRKRPDTGGASDLVPDTELATDSYHPGPYTVALDNPASRHADLVGITLNSVESYAPYGTKAQEESLLVGYRTPVTGGLTYAPSVYAGWWGVSVATDLLEAVLKDGSGNTVQQLGPLVSGVSGTSTHARRTAPAFTAHPEAVYFEIVSGGASDGRVVVMAFQLDEGAVTAYTNENALSGTRTVILDTKLPLADLEPRLEFMSLIRTGDWLNASVIFTNDDATDVTYRFRTTDDDPRLVVPSWGAWTTDFAAVAKLRFWEIEATLTSTDAVQSPTVSEMSVEAIRNRPMLLRPDGSDYPGGIQAIDVTAPYPVRISESITSDSNVTTTRYRGRPKDVRTMDLQLYSDDAARMLIEDIQTGEPNVIEDPRIGTRFGARLKPPDAFDVNREAHFPTTEAVLSWILDGSTEFEVISEENLK